MTSNLNWAKFDDAVAYATGLREEVDIMLSPATALVASRYHVIRPFGTPHWRSHGYELIAQVRLEVKVYSTKPLPPAKGTCHGDLEFL